MQHSDEVLGSGGGSCIRISPGPSIFFDTDAQYVSPKSLDSCASVSFLRLDTRLVHIASWWLPVGAGAYCELVVASWCILTGSG